MPEQKQKISVDNISIFKKGLAYQRERFKASKNGEGLNNYDLMCDAIENLKSDLKSYLIKHEKKEILYRVQKIINWFRTLEIRHITKTSEGTQIIFPPNIDYLVNKNLTIAYELLVEQMNYLELL